VTLHSKILGDCLSEGRSLEVAFWFSIRLHREKAPGRGDEVEHVFSDLCSRA
jgi:hypothetical protein